MKAFELLDQSNKFKAMAEGAEGDDKVRFTGLAQVYLLKYEAADAERQESITAKWNQLMEQSWFFDIVRKHYTITDSFVVISDALEWSETKQWPFGSKADCQQKIMDLIESREYDYFVRNRSENKRPLKVINE